MCASFLWAALLLILWCALFSPPCSLSTGGQGTCVCSSGNAVLWVGRTRFLAVPEWRSSSAGNKQNPFICATSYFLHWKLCCSNTGHHARGTLNHRTHWAHPPDVTWNFGGKLFWISLPQKNSCHIWSGNIAEGNITFTWCWKIKQELWKCHASGKLLWVMSSKFSGCLSTPLLWGSTLVEDCKEHTERFLKVANCYRLDPGNLALWDDFMQLGKILKY